MSVSRILIFGEPLLGKAKLMAYLRHAHPDLPVKELDEELTWANGGSWPVGADYRQDNLVPYVLDQIEQQTDIIFLASYIEADRLAHMVSIGFRIVILEISRDQWLARDHSRFTRTHHAELSAWTLGHPDFVDGLERTGQVDHYIDGEMTADRIAKELIELRRELLQSTR